MFFFFSLKRQSFLRRKIKKKRKKKFRRGLFFSFFFFFLFDSFRIKIYAFSSFSFIYFFSNFILPPSTYNVHWSHFLGIFLEEESPSLPLYISYVFKGLLPVEFYKMFVISDEERATDLKTSFVSYSLFAFLIKLSYDTRRDKKSDLGFSLSAPFPPHPSQTPSLPGLLPYCISIEDSSLRLSKANDYYPSCLFLEIFSPSC